MLKALLFINLSLLLFATADSVSAQDGTTRMPNTAVAGLDVADGLQVSLLAAEPMLRSPSNIDVDHMGRVWVCEVVNYRHFANKTNPAREAGDRIAVLEDTNGDGILDKDTTFYQGRDIDSAHGVCVLGNRVIVSAGENVFNFFDDDGDLKADRREAMFTGIKGVQHDHGIHSFTFGPDGRLYFNFGNNGNELHSADGRSVVDVAGNEVIANRHPYQEGMAFRCELDGSKVDTFGWNFRNNWELCVDSFGTVWQSDNDDDGNRGVRINYVMEYGNYGYKDEFTGASWRERRTGWEDEIPKRHWHLNDPGVVPNLLETGAGSPTGIVCYEGDLLPDRFRNQLIHCDAGPGTVRSYVISEAGAGYKATINDVLDGTRDQWFRPSDVCVAPDGSLIIADWYDPGVGGHRQGDIERGRLFRVAPAGSRYTIKAPDLRSIDGALAALRSPNVSTRYLAFQKLKTSGLAAERALQKMFEDDSNSRFRARALWLLGQIDGQRQKYITAAISDVNSDVRIAGLRLARQHDVDVAGTVSSLCADANVEVRRECAVALRHLKSKEKAALWARLAMQMPSHDRWYVEALGIGADGDWDNCMAAFAKSSTDTAKAEVAASLIWRSRGSQSAKSITDQIVNFASVEATASNQHVLLAYFRALDFQPKSAVAAEMNRLIGKETMLKISDTVAALVIAEALQRLDGKDIASNPDTQSALDQALIDMQGTSQYIQLVERFNLTDRYSDILKLSQNHPAEQIGVEAIRSLLQNKQWKLLSDALRSDDQKLAMSTAEVMGNSLESSIAGVLIPVVSDVRVAIAVRQKCVRAAAKVQYAASELGKLIDAGKLNTELSQTAAAALHAASSRSARELADRLFPLPPGKEGKPLPAMANLLNMAGNVANGRLVFNTTGTCQKCHVINKIGREIGPDLSEVGSKLSRQAMFESIIYPSAGISHNYEAYTLVLTSGTTVNGLITSETDDSISIKGDDAVIRTFRKDAIDEKVRQKISLMPADLQKLMSAEELTDVVDYLMTLRKKSCRHVATPY